MNKLLKINFVLSAIFLSGCNGGKVDDYFKEYSFTQALSSEEKNSLYESMKENASSLKKISSKKETYEETELYKNTSSSELTTIFYDDPSNPDLWIRENNQNNRVSRCANGITFNRPYITPSQPTIISTGRLSPVDTAEAVFRLI